MAASDSGMSTKVLRRLKMSLDYNTRSFAPLANVTTVIFPPAARDSPPIHPSVIPQWGKQRCCLQTASDCLQMGALLCARCACACSAPQRAPASSWWALHSVRHSVRPSSAGSAPALRNTVTVWVKKINLHPPQGTWFLLFFLKN